MIFLRLYEVSKIEKFIKDFIEKLIKFNGYNVLQIESFSGIQGQWAITKSYDNMENVIIFSHENKIGRAHV